MPLLLCLLAALLLRAIVAGAQALPLDERGRVSFAEVVPADSAAGRLVGARAFGVYDRGYISRRLHGKVRYRLMAEVKNGRCRAQFTDFSFACYREDRTARPQPTGQTKPPAPPAARGSNW